MSSYNFGVLISLLTLVAWGVCLKISINYEYRKNKQGRGEGEDDDRTF